MVIAIWFLVILGIFLAVAAMEMGTSIAERRWKLNQLRRDNAALIDENRMLRAENRRLACRVNAKHYQFESEMELALGQMRSENEKLQAENEKQRRELQVKGTMLKALEGKVVAG